MNTGEIRELSFQSVIDTVLKPASVKVGGFPEEIFISITEEEKAKWSCSICFLIINDCRECSNGHLFCNSCIFTWSLTFGENSHRCPVCRVDQPSYAENKAVGLSLADKEVKCPETECPFSGPLVKFLKHGHGREKFNNEGLDLETLRPSRANIVAQMRPHFLILTGEGEEGDGAEGDGQLSPLQRAHSLRMQLHQGRLMIHQMMSLLHLEMHLRQRALVSYTQTRDPNERLQRLDEVLTLNEQLNEVGTTLTTLLGAPLARLELLNNNTGIASNLSNNSNSNGSERNTVEVATARNNIDTDSMSPVESRSNVIMSPVERTPTPFPTSRNSESRLESTGDDSLETNDDESSDNSSDYNTIVRTQFGNSGDGLSSGGSSEETATTPSPRETGDAETPREVPEGSETGNRETSVQTLVSFQQPHCVQSNSDRVDARANGRGVEFSSQTILSNSIEINLSNTSFDVGATNSNSEARMLSEGDARPVRNNLVRQGVMRRHSLVSVEETSALMSPRDAASRIAMPLRLYEMRQSIGTNPQNVIRSQLINSGGRISNSNGERAMFPTITPRVALTGNSRMPLWSSTPSGDLAVHGANNLASPSARETGSSIGTGTIWHQNRGIHYKSGPRGRPIILPANSNLGISKKRIGDDIMSYGVDVRRFLPDVEEGISSIGSKSEQSIQQSESSTSLGALSPRVQGMHIPAIPHNTSDGGGGNSARLALRYDWKTMEQPKPKLLAKLGTANEGKIINPLSARSKKFTAAGKGVINKPSPRPLANLNRWKNLAGVKGDSTSRVTFRGSVIGRSARIPKTDR